MCPTDKREIPSNAEGLMPCDALLVLLLADEGSDEKAGQGGVNLTDGSVVIDGHLGVSFRVIGWACSDCGIVVSMLGTVRE